MIREEDVRRLAREDFSKMQGSCNTEEIELIKRSIKKEVGMFRRSSFLAYVFSALHHKEMAQHRDAASGRQPNGEAVRLSGERKRVVELKADPDGMCSFWCNLKFNNRIKGEELFRFIEKECSLPAGSVSDYKAMKFFSFFKVKNEYSETVKSHFSEPCLYNGRKMVVRVKGERADKERDF